MPDFIDQLTSPSAATKQAPVRTDPALPSEPQITGSYLPNFRKSLLGRSLNRYSSFVTSGAEDWILRGCQVPASEPADTDSTLDCHFVDPGPSWRSKVPPFQVLVHSPYKYTPAFSSSFTLYQITSIFSSIISGTHMQEELESSERVTVHRRFSHFVSLHSALIRTLPGIALPALPGKQYTGRFSDSFVEARRADLERYLSRLIRHPVVRYAAIVMKFLSCESESVCCPPYSDNPSYNSSGMAEGKRQSHELGSHGCIVLCWCLSSFLQY